MGKSDRVIGLTGMMGTGKSTTGRALAERLGWAFVDLDAVVEANAGARVADIFARDGEAAFRTREIAAVAALSDILPRPCILATGGWTAGDPGSLARLTDLGPLVCLTADAETLADRLRGSADAARPLAPGADPLHLQFLSTARQPVYDSLPLQVDTAGRTVAAVVDHVLQLLAATEGLNLQSIPVRIPGPGADGRARPGHGVTIGAGSLAALGAFAAARGLRGRAVVVSDANVGPLYGAGVVDGLRSAGIAADLVLIPAREAAKSMTTVVDLHGRFVAAGLGRDGAVVALGGGVVGDTAGFAAATYLRGVPWIVVPTSLLAMVDAAVGGKTGVNLAAGKNLAGAFHAPAAVVIDPAVLSTLPAPELRSGLAEVIKAGIVADPALFSRFEIDPPPDIADTVAWAAVIAASVRVKAAIVGEDPFEHGRRILLNLGHTFAHALERSTAYALPHGEAVAVGLVAAARLAADVGYLREGDLPDRIVRTLANLGLPTRWSGPPVADVIAAMQVDKKRQGQDLRFVLPRAVGDVGVVEGVPPALVEAALAATRRGDGVTAIAGPSPGE